METSKLAAALAKAQGAMSTAKKDSTNPHFKARYADLASVWDACRKPLSDNGLSVAQPMAILDGVLGVRTILMHESGETLEGFAPLLLKDGATPQQVGSAVTYMRRYSLSAMVGIAPDDDDDGNAAEEASRNQGGYRNGNGVQHRQQTAPRQQQDDNATFARARDAILQEMARCKTVTALERYAAENKMRIQALPDNMAAVCRNTYKSQLDALKAAQGPQADFINDMPPAMDRQEAAHA